MITEQMREVVPRATRALKTLGNKPITPRQHALLDYSNSLFLALAPQLFRLTGMTARLAAAQSLMEASVNLLSDTPVALKRVIPFQTHRAIDKWTGVALLAAALATDGARNRRNFRFAISQVILGAVVYNLTDWDGDAER